MLAYLEAEIQEDFPTHEDEMDVEGMVVVSYIDFRL